MRRVGAAAALAVCGFTSLAGAQTATAPDVAVKAALIFNFAKFTEWPSQPAGSRIAACVVGDDSVAAALVRIVGGQAIGGHPFDVSRPQESGTWKTCQVLFIAVAESGRAASGLGGIRSVPVLTVSDSKGFAESGGIIELYVENDRMRFAINVDAAERAGLHLSSHLLQLARVVRDIHGP
jgi:hypothetical protein